MRRILLILLLVIPLLLLGTLFGLLGTRAGNLWLLERARPYLPGELVVENWRGNLLNGVRVDRLSYRQGADDQTLAVEIDGLDLEAAPRQLWYGWLQLRHLRADAVTLTLPAGEPADPDAPPFALPERLAPPLGVRVDELRLGRFTLNGDAPLVIEELRGDDLAADDDLALPSLALSVQDTRLEATLNGQLEQPYALDGELRWRRPARAELQNEATDDAATDPGDTSPADSSPLNQAAGHLTLSGTPEKLHLAHRLSAPLRLDSEGELGYRDGEVSLDLTHTWPAQALPVDTPVPVALGAGRLTTRGDLEAVDVEGAADLTADGHPIHLALAGQAGLQRLVLTRLAMTSEKQTLTLTGQLDYADGIAWDLDARGRHLNPAVVAPDWPADLALDTRTRGHWRGADDWSVVADPLRLEGRLKGAPMTLTGRAEQPAGGDLAVTLDGRWGEDRLRARGRVGDQWHLDGQVSVARLSRWHAPAAGRLEADWQLRGALKTPRLSGTARGEALGYQDWHLAALEARFQNLTPGDAAMSLALRGDNLTQAGVTRVDALTLDLEGRRDDHQLVLTARADDADTRLALNAGLDTRNRWRGEIREWRLSQPRAGTWQLQQPAPFELSADRQSLDTLCLTGSAGGRLCAEGSHRGGAVDGRVSIAALPLSLAEPWLGDGTRVDGELNADARVGGTLQALSGQWRLNLDGTELTLTTLEEPATFRLSDARLEGTLDDNRLDNQLDLVIADQGELHARVGSGLGAEAPLDGDIRVDVPSLADLAPLIPRVGEVAGRLTGDLTLGGNPARPSVSGELALKDGRATVPDLGITVERVRLSVRGDATGALRLEGRAGLGDGTLNLDGRWSPTRSPLALSLTATGERLRVANRSDAVVYVSPDLKLEGDGDVLRLTGDLNVPEADLKPRELPESAVTVSKDQVLVDARAEQSSGLPLAMAVSVSLGDKVRFEGFGLTATLNGDLRVTQQPGQPAQLDGELVIVEGRYRAYGQNLAIENGRLLFQGAPDNPALDIRAIRRIPSENQVVGVQLSGTLQQPDARIFSDPALEESQAMSYLITGRSLNSGSDSDGAKVAQALALYGLQKGAGVTRKIGDTLGLDEISIGSDWETEDAALMLGKRLSDRLYLTYAVGLFDAISTVMLRYTLTRTLHLEAQSSSKEQAIDLIWEKELR
ncbi:MAG: translocation/assembly module TamB domain-containing protein [Alcanivorax sp.]